VQFVIKFYKRRRDSSFGSQSPILICGEQVLPPQVVSRLSELIDHPVQALEMPARVPPQIRLSTYLTCLGLIMRRTR
jgi:hypothetical protein